MSPVPAPARLPARTGAASRSGGGVAVRSATSTRPATQPAVTARPRLRLVDNSQLEVAVRRRRARRLLMVAGVVAIAALLALAGVNAVLVSNQVRIDTLEQQVVDAQARHQALRLEVATLEAPQRVVSAATERLGMISPDTITYVQPAPEGTQPSVGEPTSPTEGAPASSASSTSWGTVKPYLSR